MPDDLSPEAVAQAKRQTALDMSDQGFRMWQHEPITAAFFQFLEDRVLAARETAADLVEQGRFVPGARPELQNPDVVRGQILALRELHKVTAQTIHDFYGKEMPEEDQADQA